MFVFFSPNAKETANPCSLQVAFSFGEPLIVNVALCFNSNMGILSFKHNNRLSPKLKISFVDLLSVKNWWICKNLYAKVPFEQNDTQIFSTRYKGITASIRVSSISCNFWQMVALLPGLSHVMNDWEQTFNNTQFNYFTLFLGIYWKSLNRNSMRLFKMYHVFVSFSAVQLCGILSNHTLYII